MNEVPYELQSLLFPSVSGISVMSVEAEGGKLRVEARCTSDGAACPACKGWSRRAHSSYLRHPADLPVAGRTVTLVLRVRRFFCEAVSCTRRTFVEQVPGLTRRHGRSTERLRETLGAVGLALAGRAGARLARLLGIATSRSTLLRRVMELPDPIADEPRAVGVDDFALRRGHVYGTVIINAETHQVLDLLPERNTATLTPWLAAHPGIEVVCRDRAGAYAANTAAPQALQVADRFHLWQNLTTAVEKAVTAHRSCLRDLSLPAAQPEPVWETPLDSTGKEAKETGDPVGKLAARVQAHHALVHELMGQGLSLREIARHLSWSRNTVRRYAHAARWQDLAEDRWPHRGSKLDPFKPYLEHRWAEAEGRLTAAVLYREITECGYTGSYSTVRDWARTALPRTAAPTPAPPPLSVREATGLLTKHPAALTEDEKLRRKALLDHCLDLATAAELTSTFAEMLTALTGEDLPEWIDQAAAASLPGISTFATGLRSDFDAVTAGLTTDWNSGPVEGAVNRIKMLKRQMFGRAGFDLLRKRVLLA